MAAKFPHEYGVNLSWTKDRLGNATSMAEGITMVVGPPRQFDGPGKVWSPEDLFLASIQSCLMTTFFALAERRKLKVTSFESQVRGELDKTHEGILFTKIVVEITVATDDNEKAERLLRLSDDYCIVSNALINRPELELKFL